MSESTEIAASLVLDDKAAAVLAKLSLEFENLKKQEEEAKKKGEHLFEGGAMAVAAGEMGAHAAEAILEKVKEGLEEIPKLLGEAWKSGLEELEGPTGRRGFAGILGMNSNADIGRLTDIAGFYKDALGDIAIEAGEVDTTLEEAFANISARSSKSSEDVLKLVESMAEAGKATPGGVEALQAGFSAMEQGMIRAKNPVVQLIAQTGELHGNAKSVAAQLQKMSPEEAMKKGEEAIEKMAQKMKNVPPTISSMMKAAKTIEGDIFENIGVPIVERMQPVLMDLREAFLRNKDAIYRTTENIGKFVAGITVDFVHGVEELAQDAAQWVKENEALIDGLKDAGKFLGEALKEDLSLAGDILKGAGKLANDAVKSFQELEKKIDAADLSGVNGDEAKEAASLRVAEKMRRDLEERSKSPESNAEEFKADLKKMMELAKTGGAIDAEDVGNRIGASFDARRSEIAQMEAAQNSVSTKAWISLYNNAVKNHEEGLQRYAASLLANSQDLQKALAESSDVIEGGLLGIAKAAREGIAGADADEIKKMGEIFRKTAIGAVQKPEIHFNNAKIEIKQDFRDQDPQRIAVVFREDLAKNALQAVGSKLAIPLGV